MKNRFTLREPISTFISVEVYGAYSFNESQRMQWLQRLAIWTLEKLGCQYRQTQKEISYHQVTLDDIFELIMRSKHAINAIYHDQADCVVLGYDQMQELELDTHYRFGFNVSDQYISKIEHREMGRMRVAGLRIVFVPWFDGIVVLPKNL